MVGMERVGITDPVLTAREAGLVGCRSCARAWPKDTSVCPNCGARVSSRDRTSLQRVWAWWWAGLICYVPANIYPMLETRTLAHTESSTIVGGAVELAEHGSYGIALIILVASVVIPVGKFMAVAYLALSVGQFPRSSPHTRHGLHEIVEYVGRWSMIDVFVVAILSSLVQLNAVAAIQPGPAALAFALSVMFTMLSAQAFDPRLIWDSIENDELGTS